MKLGTYARVSGRSQAIKGTSVDDQIARCNAWARANGHRIADIYKDPGVSGTLRDRPELARAILDVKCHQIDGILVTSLDRFARDVMVQEILYLELRDAGGVLVSIAEPDLEDAADPTRRFMRRLFGLLAEYQKDLTVMRLRLARDAVRARGGFAGGRPRYGFIVNGKKIAPDATEQVIASIIRRRRRAGRSYRQICHELESQGHKPRNGARWHPMTVKRIASRPNKPVG